MSESQTLEHLVVGFTELMQESLTGDHPETIMLDADYYMQWLPISRGLHVEVVSNACLPEHRHLTSRQSRALHRLGFAWPDPTTPNWWMLADPDELRSAAIALLQAALMVFEVPADEVALALQSRRDRGGPPPPIEIVGSIQLYDDDGNPEDACLLLHKGMDPAGLAQALSSRTRIDLGDVAIFRHPAETDHGFMTRLDEIIRALVSA